MAEQEDTCGTLPRCRVSGLDTELVALRKDVKKLLKWVKELAEEGFVRRMNVDSLEARMVLLMARVNELKRETAPKLTPG